MYLPIQMKELALILSMLATQAFGQEWAQPKTLMPPVNQRIAVDDKLASDMTEAKFNELIDKVYAVYKPIVEKWAGPGKPFIINRRWKDDIVNADAMQWSDTWRVTMYGGLARHPLMTDDAVISVVCHEIGHHIGGAPIAYTKDGRKHWATNEGQADYFATTKCLKRVFQNDDNIAIVVKMHVVEAVTKACNEVYRSQAEVALCQRIAMASKAEALMMASYTDNIKVSFTTPDRTQVVKTDHQHPEPQCRLDTAFQGLLCDRPSDEEMSKEDPSVGSCTTRQGFKIGMRPRCWYKPEAAEI